MIITKKALDRRTFLRGTGAVRDSKVAFTGKIDALKRFKNDASEVKQGFECGISLQNFNDLKPGDVIECFASERVATEAFV